MKNVLPKIAATWIKAQQRMHPQTRPMQTQANRHAGSTIVWFLMVVASLYALFAIHPPEKAPTALERVQQSNVLRVVMRSSPATYYPTPNGITGLEYLMAQQFADSLGVRLEVLTVTSLDELRMALAEGRADLAAGVTLGDDPLPQLRATDSYMASEPVVIYRNDQKRPNSIFDLIGTQVLIAANDQHSTLLKQLKRTTPNFTWTETSDRDSEQLLAAVKNGDIDYTIVNSNEFLLLRSYYTELDSAFSIGQPMPVAWVFNDSNDNSLFKLAQTYISTSKADGSIVQLSDRTYGSALAIQQRGSQVFVQRVTKRLPRYQSAIEKVADEFSIDWRLLAAISYQESHWDPDAESPTGVRGMMMLTKATAKEVGIHNRLDTTQSLRGGAKYLRNIYQRLPASIPEPDRTWFALAAYNVGLAHLEDARRITDSQNSDPNAWSEVKERLPLLKKAHLYKQAKHGYARGDEPVHFVQRIRHFYELLTWNFPPDDDEHEDFVIGFNQLAYSPISGAAKSSTNLL